MPDSVTILSISDIERNMEQVRDAAQKAHQWIALQTENPIEFLKAVKFEKQGFHPITHHALNLVEQINQTWTYLVALQAARFLLEHHPSAGGFSLAPGASASQALDVMSTQVSLVGAEIFAATSPKSNG